MIFLSRSLNCKQEFITNIAHVCEARPVKTLQTWMQTCCGLEGLARSNPSRFIFDIVFQLHATGTGPQGWNEGREGAWWKQGHLGIRMLLCSWSCSDIFHWTRDRLVEDVGIRAACIKASRKRFQVMDQRKQQQQQQWAEIGRGISEYRRWVAAKLLESTDWNKRP